MSEELKPCPFCGAVDGDDNATMESAIVAKPFRSAIAKTAYRVECKCGSMGAPSIWRHEAIAAWNRRPTPKAPE